jgi:hypothetical protein
VIDSADILANPQGALSALCAALDIPFTERMLHWPAGPKPYDGTWAPHWYNAVHQSTGFGEAEGTLPTVSGALAVLVDTALPHFLRLAAHSINFIS